MMLWKLIYLLALLQTLRAQTFDHFRTEMEGIVRDLASQMEVIYRQKRCSDQVTQCNTKSYNFCEGTSEMYCNEDFPSSCQTKGAFVSQDSSIRFPLQTNLFALNQQNKKFICTSALLQDHFHSLDEDRSQKYTLAYIGNQYGSFRQYPTATQGKQGTQCINYDPRLRPWYVTATTGPKNLIIMLDISGSLVLKKGKIQVGVEKIIESLSSVDFVGVIAFNDTAVPLHSDKIERATREKKQSLKQEIKLLNYQGQTNFTASFIAAMSMLQSATEDEYGSPCLDESILLLFSDGKDTDQINTTEIVNIINQQPIPIKIFTYSLGEPSQINLDFLKDLTCQFGGISFQSNNIDDLLSDLEGYYQYISQSANITEPIWSEPYEDAFGFGMLFTVSVPVYYKDENVNRIIGVAGVDILHQKMLSFGFDEETVITKLITNKCPVASLSQCELEYYRDQNNCGIQNCPQIVTLPTCTNNQTSNIFKSPVETKVGYCCPIEEEGQEGNSDWVIAVSAVGGVGVLALVIAGGYLIKKRMNKRSDKYSAHQSNKLTSPKSGDQLKVHLERVKNSPILIPKCDLDDLQSN